MTESTDNANLWRTEPELAQELQCSTKKLYNDRKAGKLTYRKIGRLVRYYLPDVVREYGRDGGGDHANGKSL